MNKINKILLNKNINKIIVNSINNNINKKYLISKICFSTTTTTTKINENIKSLNNNKINKYNLFKEGKKQFYSSNTIIEPTNTTSSNEFLKKLNEKIESEPNEPKNYIERARIFRLLDQFEQSKKDFEKVLELTKPINETNREDRNIAFNGLAGIQSALKNYQDAINIIDETFQENNGTVLDLILKAECFFEMKDYASSKRFYNLAYRFYDKDSHNLDVRLFGYSLIEQLTKCYIHLLQDMHDNNNETSIKSIIDEIPKELLEKLKQQSKDNTTIDQLFENSKEFVECLDSIIKKNLDQSSKDVTTKIEHIVNALMGICACSMELINIKNIPDYQNDQTKSIEESLFQINNDILKNYF